MNLQWSFIFLLTACVHISYQRSTPESKTYRAAVVEYPSKYLGDSVATYQTNVVAYEGYIRDAATQGVDIIVFPEDGLSSLGLPGRDKLEPWTTLVPPPSEKYKPCTNDTIPVSETMKRLSCAAANNGIYVVVNLAEKEPCKGSNCSDDDMLYYNCNVAFDRNGVIIARYRKTNLFNEVMFNVTKEPEVVTFDTDFGVTFGTFICFDILFEHPAIVLTRSKGVRDIVYSTAWFSETPFLTAVQIQSSWSYVEDVNLLASGYHNPKSGNGGSGIYLGKEGIANATMPLYGNYPQLIIADVPKKETKTNLEPPHKKEHEIVRPSSTENKIKKLPTLNVQHLRLLRDNSLLDYENLPVMDNSVKDSVCQNNFCCSFTIEITKKDPKVNYRLIAINGLRTFQNVRNAYIRVCGIVQCSNDTIESCGSATDTETTFANISIEAQFDDYRNSCIMPMTLNTSVYPLKDWNLEQHYHEDHVHVELSMNAPTKNLATFGLYSRYFARDDIKSVASATVVHILIIAIAFMLGRFL